MNLVEGYSRLGQQDTSESIELAPTIWIVRLDGKLPAPEKLQRVGDFGGCHPAMDRRLHIRLETCPCRLLIAGMQFCHRMVPREVTPENVFSGRGTEERLYRIAGTFWLAGFIGDMSTRMDGPWITWLTAQRVLGERVRLIKAADLDEDWPR
jgi:hypothetical protein